MKEKLRKLNTISPRLVTTNSFRRQSAPTPHYPALLMQSWRTLIHGLLSHVFLISFNKFEPAFRRYFPDFKHNGILRFSRVFAANSRPTLHNQIWWPSKTFRKDSGAPPKRAESDEKTNGEADEKVVIARKEFCLDIAETPKVDECAPDDAVQFDLLDYVTLD